MKCESDTKKLSRLLGYPESSVEGKEALGSGCYLINSVYISAVQMFPLHSLTFYSCFVDLSEALGSFLCSGLQ